MSEFPSIPPLPFSGARFDAVQAILGISRLPPEVVKRFPLQEVLLSLPVGEGLSLQAVLRTEGSRMILCWRLLEEEELLEEIRTAQLEEENELSFTRGTCVVSLEPDDGEEDEPDELEQIVDLPLSQYRYREILRDLQEEPEDPNRDPVLLFQEPLLSGKTLAAWMCYGLEHGTLVFVLRDGENISFRCRTGLEDTFVLGFGETGVILKLQVF